MSSEADFSDILGRYVVQSDDGINRVRYRAWKTSAADLRVLNPYVDYLQAQSPATLTAAERMVFWINHYNAATLQVVLERYPVKSIRQIRSRTLDPRGLIGPWFERRLKVEGRKLSLNDIENSILRKEFNDPRIHYAINCASNGCPSLQPELWSADSLNSALDRAACDFIDSSRGVWTDAAGHIRLSSIYVNGGDKLCQMAA